MSTRESARAKASRKIDGRVFQFLSFKPWTVTTVGEWLFKILLFCSLPPVFSGVAHWYASGWDDAVSLRFSVAALWPVLFGIYAYRRYKRKN